MCVIFFAHGVHPKYHLIVLANRDEFYDRPTAPAARWIDHPTVYAGRDLVAGGTWLGVNDDGRFAAVTNFREPGWPKGTRSRGHLVSEYLVGHIETQEYFNKVQEASAEYSGFNLIGGEAGGEIYYFSNRGDGVQGLEPGTYGLSNHLLNTRWPKVSSGLERFAELLATDDVSTKACLQLLSDDTLAADEDLPDTGIGLEHERVLSSIFIRSPNYGTRSSTVVKFDNDGMYEFEEKTFV
jgi:uncharacterized protein with NRDE domain